ncbi:outer membrane beta-barrel protein [Terasakiella sp. SH-1]|uniref:outer membrane protein n=1 Tax=Terasakiella sp. SH-1 TaxID=2560057 RepID=UPI0010742EBD|nr:outer membrane beta-barrel protein [Terasakiella sp. SH-1]
MKTITKGLGLALSASLLASTAYAEGAALKDGPYVGASIGLSNSTSDYKYFPYRGAGFGHGPEASLMVGYTGFYDRFVWGGEIEHAISKDRASGDKEYVPSLHEIEIKRRTALTGKFGYLLDESVSVYGEAGLAIGRFFFNERSINQTEHKTRYGVTWGLGTDVALSDNLSLNLEYNRTNFQNYTFHARTFESIENNLFKVGVKYAFGGDAASVKQDPVIGKFDGFYAGASLGYGGTDYDAKTNEANNPENMLGGVSTEYGLKGGYGLTLNDFYLGGELAYAYTPKDDFQYLSANTVSMVRRNEYSALARLGYKLSDRTLPYILAGVSRAEFDQGKGSNSEMHRWLNGVTFGLGLEYFLTENVSARIETKHTKFEDFEYTISEDTFAPTTMTSNIALTYHF